MVIGRQIFAVGSNEEAARLSGIKTDNIRIFAYMFSGLMAAIAGIIMTARINSGQPTIGVAYEANAIAAAVIGGASMAGGHGSISGTILGAFIMSVLMSGLNLLNVSQNWQLFATGLVMIFAVYLDKIRRERGTKK
jgi:ribose transport system permease protein